MKVVISPYDAHWKVLFQIEKELLENVLAPLAPVIEHIGSTSVEGLDAKTTIDIMIGLQDESLFPAAIKMMLASSYFYVKKYDVDMPERRLFMKLKNFPGSGKKIFDLNDELPDRQLYPSTHNIHSVKSGGEFWNRHIAFRNQLRKSKTDRDEYAALKHELAKKDWNSINDYTEAKSKFIESIEKK